MTILKRCIAIIALLTSTSIFAGSADSTLISNEAGSGQAYSTQHGGQQASQNFERTLYKCPTGTTWDGQTCQCPSGQFYDGLTCVSCISNKIWGGTSCICPPTVPTWNASYNLCELCTYGATGPDGTYWASIKSCTVSGVTCPSGTSWNGSQCACGSGTSWDSVAMSCMTNCVNSAQSSTSIHTCVAPQVGTVTSRQDYTCYNATRGTWGGWYDTSNTCANPAPPAPPPPLNCSWGGGTVGWGAGCSAYVGATTMASGSSTYIGNTASGFSGGVTYTCSNGSFYASGATCAAN